MLNSVYVSYLSKLSTLYLFGQFFLSKIDIFMYMKHLYEEIYCLDASSMHGESDKYEYNLLYLKLEGTHP